MNRRKFLKLDWLKCKWQHDWQSLSVVPILAESEVDLWCICRRCDLKALVDPDLDMYIPEFQLK